MFWLFAKLTITLFLINLSSPESYELSFYWFELVLNFGNFKNLLLVYLKVVFTLLAFLIEVHLHCKAE